RHRHRDHAARAASVRAAGDRSGWHLACPVGARASSPSRRCAAQHHLESGMSAFGTVHRRNMRWGLESTSLYSNAPRTGLEAFILLAVTNSAVFSLGPAAVSLVTTALTTIATTAVVGGLQFLLMPKPPK